MSSTIELIPNIQPTDTALKYRVNDVRIIFSTFKKEIEDDEKYIKQYKRKYTTASLISKIQSIFSTVIPTVFLALWVSKVQISTTIKVIEMGLILQLECLDQYLHF